MVFKEKTHKSALRRSIFQIGLLQLCKKVFPGWGAWNMPAAAETDSPSGPPTFYPASQTLPALRDLPVLPSSSGMFGSFRK